VFINVEYDHGMILICFRLKKKAYARYESQNYEVAKVIWSRGEEVLVTWPYSEMEMEQLDCQEKLEELWTWSRNNPDQQRGSSIHLSNFIAIDEKPVIPQAVLDQIYELQHGLFQNDCLPDSTSRYDEFDSECILY